MKLPAEFRLYSGTQIIGTAALRALDESGVATGTFSPAGPYETVRRVFKLFHESCDATADPGVRRAKLAHYYRRRDTLQLFLKTAAGQVVPTTWVHIVDSGDAPTDCNIEVQFGDERRPPKK